MNLKLPITIPQFAVTLGGAPYCAFALRPPVIFVSRTDITERSIHTQRWAWGLEGNSTALEIEAMTQLDHYELRVIPELACMLPWVQRTASHPTAPHPRCFTVHDPLCGWFGIVTVGKLGWAISGGHRDAEGRFPYRSAAGATKALTEEATRLWDGAFAAGDFGHR